MCNIIKLPEYSELEKEVKELREKLSQVVFEHDELKYTICENIKIKYLLEIGSLEYRAYEIYCKYLRLRRKKDLIQSKINRQEKINLKEIDKQLDKEFLEYMARLSDRLIEINHAIDLSEKSILSYEESKEFKRIYKKLIKKLHPDLNPNLSDEQKELFYKVVEAYKNGNFYFMKILDKMIGDEKEDNSNNGSLSNLMQEKKRLSDLIREVEVKISNIKNTTPYIWKKYLDDEGLKNKKLKELNDKINSYLEAIKTQQEYIKKMMEIWDEWFSQKRWTSFAFVFRK